jgi:hypothetical protein
MWVPSEVTPRVSSSSGAPPGGLRGAPNLRPRGLLSPSEFVLSPSAFLSLVFIG